MALYKSREELEHDAMAAAEKQEAEENKEPYVERSKGIRALAWVLFALVVIGVILYYFWIARGGRL